MNSGRKLVAAVVSAATMMCAPAAAQAAVTASVTGDGGTPVALVENGSVAIRNMDVRAYVHVDDSPDTRSYQWQVLDASGTGATTLSGCWPASAVPDDSRLVTYRGNQSYTLKLNLYPMKSCAGTAKTAVYSWSTAATVSLGQPAGTLLIRRPNSFSTITQQLDFAGTPGAVSYEIKYAKNAAVAGDGSITGLNVQDAYLDRTTGKVQVYSREPGSYLVVARAKNGDYTTPWSAPVSMRLQQPFDVLSGSFPDRRGPSYQLRTVMRDGAAAGSRVRVAIAYGKKGKKFRTVGSGKVSSKGVFKVRFTVRKLGWYRVRYAFSGNANVAKGSSYAQIRFRRVIF